MLKHKKALAGRQLVLLILALFILGFLIYRIFFAQQGIFEVLVQIKDAIFS